MEYQIILLPAKDYWDWVRACRDYVKQYGANLTDSPETAGRYMAPAQVITYPQIPGGYPDFGDLEDWFQQHHAGIRLDPVEVSGPADLEDEFRLRIDQEDRYGQKRKSFYLTWPTDYSFITQPFGANPHIYTRFGMPGHEGIDIRALMNTNIYCCADGEVYLIHTNPKSHPYGIHIRVRHQDGYKTVYGHLAQPLVKVGERVESGQVIGKANSTGASTGSHLHLTLKRDGATKRGETIYPKDVIDPTPFLVWPERYRKEIPAPEWPAGRCLAGVHARTQGLLSNDDFAVLEALKPEAIMLGAKEPSESISRLIQIDPDLFIASRFTDDLSAEAISSSQYVDMIESNLRSQYEAGVRYFELCSAPNIQSGGYGRSWNSGGSFSEWFQKALEELRPTFPEAKFGYPGLSPGGSIPGWRVDFMTFLSDCEPALAESDWIGVHAYWMDQLGMQAPTGGRIFDIYRRRHPDKLLMITEFNNPTQNVSTKQRAEEYQAYLRLVREEDGLAAAFLYVLSADQEEIGFAMERMGDGAKEWIGILSTAW